MQHQNYLVNTNQHGPHPDVEKLVKKHTLESFSRPISNKQILSFEAANTWVNSSSKPVVLDSGCGTGLSTLVLAERFPQHVVVGIDKSAHRLKRGTADTENFKVPPNAFFMQSNLEDAWRLIFRSNWKISHHFVLYPNPWPKSEHVKRRWHGHPVFPFLIRLSPYLELRSNWKMYLEEFSWAMTSATQNSEKPTPFQSEKPISLFEKKYWQAHCPTYRLVYQDLVCRQPQA
jgi:tRNA (guanine-N7-)-methyltransferase